jgi:hypothetical protein
MKTSATTRFAIAESSCKFDANHRRSRCNGDDAAAEKRRKVRAGFVQRGGSGLQFVEPLLGKSPA